MVIAAVGAGGKTTYLHRLAKDNLQQGKSVFLTTTTHMYIEEDTLLFSETDSVEKMEQAITDQLKKTNYCMAGIVSVNGKIKSLPEAVLRKIITVADIVLMEADGAKGKWIKVPNDKEPVLYDFVDQIVVLVNMKALGKTFSEAAFRLEQIEEQFGYMPQDMITGDKIYHLIREGYVLPLRKKYPNAEIIVHPVCATDKETRAVALQN